MKIPNSSSGNDYGHETDIISYMDNNFDSKSIYKERRRAIFPNIYGWRTRRNLIKRLNNEYNSFAR